MRLRWLASLLASFAVAAGAAQAGTLTMATWTADLSLTAFPPVSLVGVPIAANGTSSATSISVSLVVPPFSLQTFLPRSRPPLPLLHLRFTQAGAQQLTATPSMAAATLGVPGTVVVMTAMHFASGPNASKQTVGFISVLRVPLDVGVNGQYQNPSFTVLGAYHPISADFFAWTPGTQTFTGLTVSSVAQPDVVAMGSFALSAMGGGTVTLVSPTRISITGLVLKQTTASYTTLKLSFVPEPAAALLLAAGVAALALVAKGRAD